MPRNEFTPEQREHIESLPRRKFMVGSTLKAGYYDEENHLIYMVDENGNLTGQVGRVQMPAQKDPESSEAYHSEERSKPHSPPTPLGEGTNPSVKRGSLAGKVITCVGIIAAIAIVGAGAFFYARQKGPAIIYPTSTPYTDSTPEPMHTARLEEDNTSAIELVTVMQTTCDILKGQQISVDDLQSVEITTQEYNQLTALGSTPSKWENLAKVDGLYAASFIPAGNYINNTNLSTTDPNPANPWISDNERFSTLHIGIHSLSSECVPFYGAVGTLTISKIIDITSESAEPAPDLSWPEDSPDPNPYSNIEYSDSPLDETHISRTFRVQDAIVADILNESGASLYRAYLPFIDMPTVNRISTISSLCRNSNNVQALTVATIVVRLTTPELSVLGDITGASLSLSLTGAADTESDVKYTVAWGTQTVAQAISAELTSTTLSADITGEEEIAVPQDVSVETPPENIPPDISIGEQP